MLAGMCTKTAIGRRGRRIHHSSRKQAREKSQPKTAVERILRVGEIEVDRAIANLMMTRREAKVMRMPRRMEESLLPESGKWSRYQATFSVRNMFHDRIDLLIRKM
jgi:hypothetical protein